MSVQRKLFKDSYMSDCYIGESEEYLFIKEKPKEFPDPFERTDFGCVIYRDGEWQSYHVIEDLKFQGGYTTIPNNEWVLVGHFGSVLRIEEDGATKWEEDIPAIPDMGGNMIEKAKVIAGKLYTVAMGREVRRRDGISNWTTLDNGLFDPNLGEENGFYVIDGFAENDIYAAGLQGEVFHWDGTIWKKIELPTNADIKSLCCGGDGLVYLSTHKYTFIVGRGNKWQVLKYNEEIVFINPVWFKDRVYMAKGSTIYEIKDGKFQESELNKHKDKPADCSFIDANDEVMLIGSKLEVATFDGEIFTTILPFEVGG